MRGRDILMGANDDTLVRLVMRLTGGGADPVLVRSHAEMLREEIRSGGSLTAFGYGPLPPGHEGQHGFTIKGQPCICQPGRICIGCLD